MTKASPSKFIPASELLFAAGKLLAESGYAEVDTQRGSAPDNARLFEGPYSIVTVAAFETWADLRDSWADYQALTAEAMTRHLTRNDPKAWDGYLVLLTPSVIPSDQTDVANEIRSNTSRLRKLLGTGEDIKSVSSVRKVLLPLLPISVVPAEAGSGSGLDALPRLLEKHNIPSDVTKQIVEAFKAQEPVMQRLHEYRSGHT